ncbi:CBS domain-containing protein [Streptomyces sp. NPDC059355]|uniref:CBS domain-containing protein n=1 Tax=Streptomyces sp. NPDC059355 TaxID=3346811 RepID=UPI003688E10E
MTLLQMQSRTAGADPAHRTADEDTDQACPQVGDDMTVEVALSVMASARAGHLLVCDEDGLCTGLVTPAQLAAARCSDAYTDRVRLRDILGEHRPFTSPLTAMAGAAAGHAVGGRRLDPLPVADEQGSAPGTPVRGLALAR